MKKKLILQLTFNPGFSSVSQPLSLKKKIQGLANPYSESGAYKSLCVTDSAVSTEFNLRISSFHFQCSDLFAGSWKNWITVLESSKLFGPKAAGNVKLDRFSFKNAS